MELQANTLFPGRPNYTGPTNGWFGLLHHEVLAEESHDVMERVAYVKRAKPKNEVNIRLHNMIYLGERWAEYNRVTAQASAEYDRVKAQAWAEYNRVTAPALAEYQRVEAQALAEYQRVEALARAEILGYIKANIPDCAWNGKELVFG